MFSLEQDLLCLLLEDGLKDSNERQFELVFKIELVVDRQVVLEGPEWILRLLEAFRSLRCLYHNVGDTITHVWGRCFVTLAHARCQLDVSLSRSVGVCPTTLALFFRSLSKALRDDK